MSEWQPLETAPKDGESILVCDNQVSDGAHQVVFWDEDRLDEWRWATSDGPTFHMKAFTHWMPLPAPPVHANQEAGR